MENCFLQTQENTTDASKGSFSLFTFFVNCVAGTLTTISSCVFTVLDFGFHYFCSLTFRCFKAVHHMFQIFDTFLAFLKSLLQLNFSLADRSLNSGVEMLTNAYRYSLAAAAAVYQFIWDIPFACSGLLYHYYLLVIDLLSHVLARTWGKYLESYESLLQLCYRTYDVLGGASSGIYSEILALAESSRASLIHVQQSLTAKTLEYYTELWNILSCTAEFIWQISSYICTKVMSLPEILLESILSSLVTAWGFITETIQQICTIFESIAEFIVLPFSLKNIEALVASMFTLVRTIVAIPFGIVSFIGTVICKVTTEVAAECKDAISSFVQIFDWFFKSISTMFVWFIIFFSVCTLVLFLLKRCNITSGLLNCGKKILRYLYHVEEDNRVERTAQISESQRDVIEQQTCQNQIPVDEVPPGPSAKTSFIEDEKTSCIICQDSEKTTVLLPCKHLCVCEECAKKLFQSVRRKRDCPLCRTKIEHIMKVYV